VDLCQTSGTSPSFLGLSSLLLPFALPNNTKSTLPYFFVDNNPVVGHTDYIGGHDGTE
jgi:hypothetical protein